jgi:TetR/AcrR family transcriptional regulator, regulator of mycofactocin system
VIDTATQSTRRRLQDAALDLFERFGFDAVTIDDIAAAAGTSRRTFFRYFATKEDAAVADFDIRIQLLTDLLAEVPRPGQSAIDRIAEAGRVVISAVWADPEFYLKRYRIVYANPPLLDRMSLDDRRYEDLIARTVREDFPTASGALHARMFAAAAMAVTNAVFERWVLDPDTDPLPVIKEGFAELGRAVAAWQGSSIQRTDVIILTNNSLSADEIRRRLESRNG